MRGDNIKDDCKTVYICDCREMSHSMRMIFDEDTDFEFCYIEFGMRARDSKGFWGRLWEGIKYAFKGEFPFTELIYNRPQMIEIKKHIEEGLKRKSKRKGGRIKMDEEGNWKP